MPLNRLSTYLMTGLVIIITGLQGSLCAQRQLFDTLPEPQGIRNSQPELVATLGHTHYVSSAALSPDGRFAVTGGVEDHTAILWDITSGREIRRFVGHVNSINAVAFSRDGRFVLTCSGEDEGVQSDSSWSKDFTARLWDVTNGAEIRRFEGHTKRVNAAGFSPDGRSVVTGSDDHTIRLWDLNIGKELKKVVLSEMPVSALAFSPNGKFLMVGTGGCEDKDNGRCDAYLIDTGYKVVHTFSGHKRTIGAISFSPDGRFVATSTVQPVTDEELMDENAGQKFVVYQWDVATGKVVRRFGGFGPVLFSHDSRTILTAGHGESESSGNPRYEWEPGGINIWDAGTGKKLRFFDGPKEPGAESTPDLGPDVATLMALDASGNRMLIGYGGVESSGNAVSSDDYSPTELVVVDINSGETLSELRRVAVEVNKIAFSKNGRAFLAEGRLWDTTKRDAVSLLENEDSEEEQALSNDGSLAWINTLSEGGGNLIYLRDDGLQKKVKLQISAYAIRFTPDNRYLVAENEGEISCYAVNSGGLVWTHEMHNSLGVNLSRAAYSYLGEDFSFTALSPDGTLVYVLPLENRANSINAGTEGELIALSVETGRIVKRYTVPVARDYQTFIKVSPDGGAIIYPAADGDYGALLISLDLKTGQITRLSKPAQDLYAVYSPDGKFIGTQNPYSGNGEIQVLRADNGAVIRRINFFAQPGNIKFSPDGNYLLALGQSFRPGENVAQLWDLRNGAVVRQLKHSGRVTAGNFILDGRFVVTGGKDGTIRIWEVETGSELCRLISTDDGDWIAITPDGRFDTNNLEEIKGLHWIIPDDPMKALPLEIFMRQYYEPQLLFRVLAGEKLKPLPPLSSLNRVQPQVTISRIEAQKDAPYLATVTVEVSNNAETVMREGQLVKVDSGVYDLRLFRDGQLVSYFPERDGEVKLDASGKARITFTNIKLPSNAEVKKVEFSAYAFNKDRVKSATDRKTFDLSMVRVSKKGRAYIITVGVNAYENTDFNLEFAADDARRMQQVTDKLSTTVQFDEIIPVSLISDYEIKDGQKIPTLTQATKENFKTVLQLLSKKNEQVASHLLKNIPNADNLREVTPDDLVLIMFSSHGYADRDGNFYFIPYDTGVGKGKIFTESVRQHSISSEELSLWLRDVDAGEMIMIVDACHSAAAIEGQEFKPGPMGSRGLGQLSYDKGMRILTATQSDNVALENGILKQGVLTYALIRDGIEARQADYKPKDNQITLAEWLSFGVARVPKLYEEVKAGRVQTFGLTGTQTKVINTSGSKQLEEVVSVAITEAKTQQPSLFDFTRKHRDVMLVSSQ